MKFDTEYSGAQINTKYLLAYLLDRSIFFIASMIVFAIVFSLVGAIRIKNTSTVEPQDILNGYRNRLTEEEANAVEGLYVHYEMCMDYLYGYYGDMKCMKNVYRFESDAQSIDILSELLTIQEDDYHRISEIYEKGDGRVHKAYERIGIEIIKNEQDNSIIGSKSEMMAIVTVYGKDQDECKLVMDVIEKSFSDVAGSIDNNHVIYGPVLSASVFSLGESYYLNSTTENTIEGLVNVGSVLSGISSASNWFSDDQKVYFNALRDNSKGRLGTQVSAGSGISLKYPILGAVFGFVSSIGLAVMLYWCNGKIKSDKELVSRYGFKTTGPVSFTDGNKRVLARCADKLRGTDPERSDINKMVAIDSIRTALKETEARKIVVIHDENSSVAGIMAEELKNDKLLEDSEIIGRGDPGSSSNILTSLEEADAVVVLTELDSTKQETVDRWISVCNRHKKPIAGNIVLFDRR